MKYSEISGLGSAELMKRKRELQEGLFEARMKNSLGQLTNPRSIRQYRKDIARINTALNKVVGGAAAQKESRG